MKSRIMRRLSAPALHSTRRLRARIRSLRRRQEGLALIEFALLAPIMVGMYFAVAEISLAVGHNRKGALMARTLADLTTQSSTLTSAQITSIFNASAKILAPYPEKDVTRRITSVRIDKDKKVWVDWSDVSSFGTTTGFNYGVLARCSDGAALVPAGLRNAGTSLVIGQVKLKHTPTVGIGIGAVTLEEAVPMIPRASDAVLKSGVATTACPGEKT